MDAAHLNTSSSQEMRIWNQPILKYSLIAAIALAAVSCFVLGAIAYSGVGLSAIGKSWGIALMVTGTIIVAGEFLAVLLMQSRSDISVLAKKLQPREMVLYQDDSYEGDFKNRLWVRHSDNTLKECVQQSNYDDFLKKNYTIVLLETLQARK